MKAGSGKWPMIAVSTKPTSGTVALDRITGQARRQIAAGRVSALAVSWPAWLWGARCGAPARPSKDAAGGPGARVADRPQAAVAGAVDALHRAHRGVAPGHHLGGEAKGGGDRRGCRRHVRVDQQALGLGVDAAAADGLIQALRRR